MICRAIRLVTWPARTAYSAAEHGIWLTRALIEIYGYGISISGPDDYEPDWSWVGGQSNEKLDTLLEGSE